MRRFFATSRSSSSRWLLVLALALTTPALQDAVNDLTTALTGIECCDDDCDDSGSPCSQECAHCPCAGFRNVTVSSVATLVMRVGLTSEISPSLGVQPSSTTLDPPFRPPVS